MDIRLRPPRDLGVDVARGVALMMMFVAHVSPTAGPGNMLVFVQYATFPLFALLVGVSAELTEVRARRTGDRGHWLRSMLLRALTLVALGLALDLLHPPVLVVLVHLGVLVVLAGLAARLPSLALVVLAAVTLAVGPVLKEAIAPATWPLSAGEQVTHLLFTGERYRVSAGLLYALLGVLLVRWTARRARSPLVAGLGVLLVAISGVFLVLEKVGRIDMPAFAGDHLEVSVTAAMAVGTFLLTRWVGGTLPKAWVRPLAQAGAMTATLYVAQVLGLEWFQRATGGANQFTWPNLVVLCGGSLLVAVLWPAVVRRSPWSRGPIEGTIAAVVR